MIPLWKENVPFFNKEYGQEVPGLDHYPVESSKRTGAVIVCAGGAYLGRSYHEGEPVAQLFQKNGIAAFVLSYRYHPYGYQAMLYDILRAVRVVRYNAEKWNIDPNRIAVCGFSAGGHLASCGATHYGFPVEAQDEIDCVSARPDAAILAYPVVTMGRYTHKDTRRCFLRDCEFDPKMEWDFSNENAVTKDTPPMFIWHTANDGAVPAENSLQLAYALQEKKVPFELHIFPDGAHGLGLADGEKSAPYHESVKQWGPLCVQWLKKMQY